MRENKTLTCGDGGALGGTRTPNLLIRSQMLYPLSYERQMAQLVYGTAQAGWPGSARLRRADRCVACVLMIAAGVSTSKVQRSS